MIRIGIDDTDSTKGGCTTHIIPRLIEEFQEYDIIGYPRLVRLNPMVPHKTRGNGAVVLSIGRGVGEPTWIGKIRGRDILGYPRSGPTGAPHPELHAVRRRVLRLLKGHSDLENGASPGSVITIRYPPQRLYWKGVRSLLTRDEVLRHLPPGALHGGMNGARGIIGAACALAWRPGDRTWELIAYRSKDLIGKPRRIDPSSVKAMDDEFPETFSNLDRRSGRILITPRSPCPVLFGIRGNAPHPLRDAAARIRGEAWETCIVFLTNQATDDHIVRARSCDVRPFRSVCVSGRVEAPPRTIPGGHVIFTIRDRWGQVECAAYEPTGPFRDIVRALIPGDRVVVRGGVRTDPVTVNLERIDVRSLERWGSVRPVCCGRNMVSLGRSGGSRCRKCRRRSRTMVRVPVERRLRPGVYHVPPSASRHISMPEERRSRR